MCKGDDVKQAPPQFDEALAAKIRLIEDKKVSVGVCKSTKVAIELVYNTFGEPSHPCVLLIMGINGPGAIWDEALCELIASRGFYVIRYDNRDVGLSTKLEGQPTPSFLRVAFFPVGITPAYTLDDMACDAVGLLTALRIPAAHIVGASMGGMIAQLIATHFPAMCLTLTLLMTHAGGPDAVQPTWAAKKSFMAAPKSRTPHDLAVHQASWCAIMAGTVPLNASAMHTRLLLMFQRSSYETLRQAAALLAAPSRVPLLKSLKVPTLVLHGQEDILVPPENGRQLAKLIPSLVKLTIVPRLGHILTADVHETVVNELMDLMAAAAGGQRSQPLAGEFSERY